VDYTATTGRLLPVKERIKTPEKEKSSAEEGPGGSVAFLDKRLELQEADKAGLGGFDTNLLTTK